MKVSVIVASRNDDHGGNQQWRTQAFIDMLYVQTQHFQVETELILVEWNPPADTPYLHSILKWPQTGAIWCAKVLVVPDYVHQMMAEDTGLEFFQWWAKNVGIRRARYEWILCTNPDVIFTDELMQQFADVHEPGIYGTHRRDLGVSFVPNKLPREKILEYCAKNVAKVNTCTVYNILTDGCGDFMLATKADWWNNRGYPQFKTWSIHLDSLTLLQMVFINGLKQTVLDGGMYHILHKGSWVTSYDHYGRTYPQFKLDEIMRLCTDMHEHGIPAFQNPDDWGLREEVQIEAICK